MQGTSFSRLLVTGARGLVGAEIARRWSADGRVVSLSHRELDIADDAAVELVFRRERPDLVVNAAAVGVDACEADPELARRINVAGPRLLAVACRRIGARLLHFSSNYVFGGEPRGGRPYTIEDAPSPVNVYGATKVEGETAVRGEWEKVFVVRTSWVFGAGKESFLGSAPARLARGERLRAIRDVRASTTYVADLVTRLAEVVRIGRYGTHHVVNAGSCSYDEFAREAARLVGRTAAEMERLIEPVTEIEMRRGAPRPRETPMRCLLSEELGLPPLRDWRLALEEYVRSGGGERSEVRDERSGPSL